MKTSVTELFGIEYPILNAGMGRYALPNMVAAVSNAGGLGVFGAGSGAPDVTRAAIREIRKLTDKPFGGNAPLALPNGMENAKVMLEEKVPVINYSMGKGDWIAKAAHEYGGKAIASVTNVNLAQRAEAHGADAVIAAGYEAAGHAGEITTFVLIPRLVEVLKIPVIAAGGVVTGAGLVAALALGAGAVSMGTRFMTTEESPLHPNWKDKALNIDVGDTVFSDRFDGIPCRMIRSPATLKMMRSSPNLFRVFMDSFGIAKELKIPYPKLFLQILASGPKNIGNMMRMSQMLRGNTVCLTTGDMETGIGTSGMSVGLVHDLRTAENVVQRIVAEAQEAYARLGIQVGDLNAAPGVSVKALERSE